MQGRGFAPKHIIDVGANHGNWTRRALKYFPDAYYTLVEPQDHLRTHVQDLLGRDGKIRWIGAVRATEPGTLPFTISYRDYFSSFTPTTRGSKGCRDTPNRSPGNHSQRNRPTSDAPFPDMIKIDAEGFDLRVLAGASKLVGKTEIFLLEATICAEATTNSQQNLRKLSGERDPSHGPRGLSHPRYYRAQPQPQVRGTLALRGGISEGGVPPSGWELISFD